MVDSLHRPAPPDLLHYRAWHAEPSSPLARLWAPWRTSWPIARTALREVFRRKLFWVLYAMALLVFQLFFFGQYLMAWARTQLGQTEVRLPLLGTLPPEKIIEPLSQALKLNGSAETFRNFIWFEGYMVMIVLALAGSVLIGNDLRFGSLAFYLSKPVSRWDYLLGKAIAVAVFVNLLTTLPALVLFVQYGILTPGSGQDPLPVPYLGIACLLGVLGVWGVRKRLGLIWLWLAVGVLVLELLVRFTGRYFADNGHLALGTLGYGAVLTVSLPLLLLATASWLQKTVPLILAWATLFVFTWLLSTALVDALHFDARWRLIDLWNCAYVVGSHCLQIHPDTVRPAPQPAWYEAALVLGGVSLSCLTYLILRIRAVEIVK